MTSSSILNEAPTRPTGALPPLLFDRTIDRSMVHRTALAEVFLTDMRALDERTYGAAAQLPRSHAYYGDHLARPATFDPLLLLETCRQATLAGAHACYQVPISAKFILTHLDLQLTPPPRFDVRSTPCPLTMLVDVVDRRVRDGQTAGLDHTIRLFADGAEIGRAALGLRFKSAEDYAALRLRQRGGAALRSSAALSAQPLGVPVAPWLVGRADPDNVVLLDAATTPDAGASATLAVPARHPSMFDHPQDHLPGMVLAEAARQIASYAALEHCGRSPAKVAALGLCLTFDRFGELDVPTTVTAQIVDPPDTGGGELPISVAFVQAGQSICTAAVRLARLQPR